MSHSEPDDYSRVNDECLNIVDIPLVVGTDESLDGYGKIVDNFDRFPVDIKPWPLTGWRPLLEGTGTLGGVVEADFDIYYEGKLCKGDNKAVNRSFTTGVMNGGDDKLCILVREANYHPDGGQVFYSKQQEPFIAMLALPGDEVKPSDFKAFYFDGSRGLHIDPNVWHQSPYPLNTRVKTAFKNKQGAVHGCVMFDSIDEYNCWLSVPLHHPLDECCR